MVNEAGDSHDTTIASRYGVLYLFTTYRVQGNEWIKEANSTTFDPFPVGLAHRHHRISRDCHFAVDAGLSS